MKSSHSTRLVVEPYLPMDYARKHFEDVDDVNA